MTKLELAYLAGIIDGEGTIGLLRNHGNIKHLFVRVKVYNMNKDLMDWILEKTGKGYHRRPKGLYVWQVNRESAKKILKTVIPYLIIKKEQALLALSHKRGHKTYPQNKNQNGKFLLNMKQLKEKSYGR